MSTPLVFVLSCIGALIPAVFYINIIYFIDRYEKEPLWLLGAAFVWGAVPSVIISFIFNSLLSIPLYQLAGSNSELWAASAIAPPVEETVKGILVLAILFFRRSEIDSLLDGIIYGAVVGMGFAVVENVYYFMNVYAEGGLEAWSVNMFMRGVVFGLNHSLFTAVTGLGVAYAFHRETEPMMGHVLADIPDHQVVEPYYELWAQAGEILLEPFAARGRRKELLRATIALGLSFHTWRKLTADQGLSEQAAVELSAGFVESL